jgi:WD40 repeat protein
MPGGTQPVYASVCRSVATGTELCTLTGHTDELNGCAFSPDGQQIVSACADGTLRIWDVGGSSNLSGLCLMS